MHYGGYLCILPPRRRELARINSAFFKKLYISSKKYFQQNKSTQITARADKKNTPKHFIQIKKPASKNLTQVKKVHIKAPRTNQKNCARTSHTDKKPASKNLAQTKKSTSKCPAQIKKPTLEHLTRATHIKTSCQNQNPNQK